MTNVHLQTVVNELRRRLRAFEEMRSALNYVADNTYCGTDAEWHFKPGYDPQVVLDAIGDE